jgi:hypothetical protein
MDPLIGQLNQRISEQVIGKKPVDLGKPTQSFADVLDSKRTNNAVMEKLSEQLGDDKGSGLKVLSANDIKINRVDFDAEKNTNFDPKQKLMDLFGGLNEDMISLDASIEVLSDPNVKLNRRQLLAYQAGIGNMTINTELFSKMAQAVSQNLTTLLNTNIG